jgi:hypothetical protein
MGMVYLFVLAVLERRRGKRTLKNLNGGTSKDGKTKETWNRNENEFCKAR